MKEVVDENSIFKLKCALKKLESPEKIKVNKKVKLIESINKKRNHEVVPLIGLSD